MSEPCIIRADYTNWRPVAGRRVLQLTLEVPIEQTAEVMERLGVPMPGESKWVAVALLKSGACASESAAGQQENAPRQLESSEAGEDRSGNSHASTNAPSARVGISPNQRERKPFSTLPLSQQAAIRCQDRDFRRYLAQKDGPGEFLMFDTEMAAEEVRAICKVDSRSKIIEGEKSGDCWLSLEANFQRWLTTDRYAGSRHA